MDPETQPTRLTYDAEMFKRATEFSESLLAAIPELHGVAVIPLWTSQPENAPNGLLQLRDLKPPFVSSLLLLVKRLTAFANDAHRDLLMQLQMFDRHAAELAATITARTEQLKGMPEPTPPNG